MHRCKAPPPDIIKRAMIDIQNWLNEGSVDARMLLQVHDELVFEVSERDLPYSSMACVSVWCLPLP
jgi:DNA polymerase I-like protein with 3'-5' exonuclease and polymerase domains